MKILVFVKQVPDTDDVKLDPKTGNLKRDGVQTTINPLDANAVETAVQLKEKYGATVCAVTMGPPQAKEVLKKALALGCDEAYLLSDRAFGGADTRATSYTLAKAAEKIGDYDLLLFGRHAVDGDTAQTGPATAAFLGIPQVTLASSIDVKDGWVYCDRVLEDSTEKVRAKLPALVTVTAEINTPRYPTPINIMKALKKPRAVWNAQELGADTAPRRLPRSCSSRPSAIPTPPTLRAAPKRSQQNSLTCSKQSTWSEEVWQMAKEDYKGIWVFAEQQNGTLNPVTYELLAKAQELKAHNGEAITAVLLGSKVAHLAAGRCRSGHRRRARKPCILQRKALSAGAHRACGEV